MKQQGAALVIVMALLSGAVMLGISAMQSALIDERLAGNYRAAVQAQMNAEKAASHAMAEFNNDKNAGRNSWSGSRDINVVDLRSDFFTVDTVADACSDSDKCAYEFLQIDNEYTILAKGGVVSKTAGRIIAESQFIKINFEVVSNSEEITNSSLANILDKVINSGNLINVLSDYDFSASNNVKAQSWMSKVSTDESLFKSVAEACLFKNALINSEVAPGVVEVVSGNINGKEFSDLSGNIVVVNEDGFTLPNASSFTGVVFVFGRDFEIRGGGNINFGGAIIHVPTDCDAKTFYKPQININGGSGLYSGNAVQSIVNQLDLEENGEGGSNSNDEIANNRDLYVSDWLWSFK